MRGGHDKMTDRKIYKYSPSGLAACFLGVFLLALMIRNSEVAIKYVRDGLSVCADVLIPSLFPFMVISDIFVRCGVADTLGTLFAAPMRVLFGVSGSGSVAIVLGALCGFPIGARCAVSLLDVGEIDRDECERLIAISSTPSAAFLISAVGVSLFGSRALGRALYFSALLASFATGVLLNAVSASRRKKAALRASDEQQKARKKIKRAAGVLLSDSISASADAMLRVCAFVLFFTAFVCTLTEALGAMNLPQIAVAAISSVFELTGGMRASASLPQTALAVPIAAFAAGWSGVSVHLQIASICDGRGIRLRPYIVSKVISGVLTAVMMSLYLRIAPPELHTDTATALITPRGAHIVSAVFVVILVIGVFKKVRKNGHKRI